jgi:DNA-binding PadR family transcriptional regulator
MYAHACHGYGMRAMTGHRGRRNRAWAGYGGWGPGGPRGPRARRGDVRAAILALLAEEPRNGYQIIQELGERTEGVWRPSPGSIYPALQQLEDEGLARTVEVEGRKAYELTDEGRAYVAEHKDEIGAPWETIVQEAPGSEGELRDLGRQFFVALMQVSHAGSEAQVKQAKELLSDARKRLYGILAADE